MFIYVYNVYICTHMYKTYIYTYMPETYVHICIIYPYTVCIKYMPETPSDEMFQV